MVTSLQWLKILRMWNMYGEWMEHWPSAEWQHHNLCCCLGYLMTVEIASSSRLSTQLVCFSWQEVCSLILQLALSLRLSWELREQGRRMNGRSLHSILAPCSNDSVPYLTTNLTRNMRMLLSVWWAIRLSTTSLRSHQCATMSVLTATSLSSRQSVIVATQTMNGNTPHLLLYAWYWHACLNAVTMASIDHH